MTSNNPARHLRTEAARTAAAEARRRKREENVPLDAAEVFVVRPPDMLPAFGWEIRSFGAFVLNKSHTGYPTMQEARAAGQRMLGGRKVEA